MTLFFYARVSKLVGSRSPGQGVASYQSGSRRHFCVRQQTDFALEQA